MKCYSAKTIGMALDDLETEHSGGVEVKSFHGPKEALAERKGYRLALQDVRNLLGISAHHCPKCGAPWILGNPNKRWRPSCKCPGLDGDAPWPDLDAHPDGSTNWPSVPRREYL